MMELKVAQESTYVSQYLKGGCYDLANHEGWDKQVSICVPQLLDWSLRKHLGSVGNSAVVHSFNRY